MFLQHKAALEKILGEGKWRPTGLAREAAGGFCSGHTGQSLHHEAETEDLI